MLNPSKEPQKNTPVARAALKTSSTCAGILYIFCIPAVFSLRQLPRKHFRAASYFSTSFFNGCSCP